MTIASRSQRGISSSNAAGLGTDFALRRPPASFGIAAASRLGAIRDAIRFKELAALIYDPPGGRDRHAL